MENDWESRLRGDNCALCAPRPDDGPGMVLIAQLSVSSLYLNRNQTYAGASILVYDTAHVARLDQLDEAEWRSYADDLLRAQRAIVNVMQPDHVNVESLGNVVPHLHWHVVPRYLDDIRWGDPIWLTDVRAMADTRVDNEIMQERVLGIREALGAAK